MKFFLPAFTILVFLSSCDTKQKEPITLTEETSVVYDSLLAQSLGADQYGMKKYVMAFLKSGPNRSQSEEEANRLQKAHMDNITRLAEEGNLVLAGPFMEEGGDLRGIYIFNTDSLELAKEWTNSDPAILEGRLIMELYPWYGSAALMKVNELHSQIAKINI